MKRLMMILAVASLMVAGAVPAVASADSAPQFQWVVTTDPHTSGSFLYLNDNVDNGNLLTGKIGTGVFEVNTAGAITQSLYTNPTFGSAIGAMSAARMGDYIYLGKTPDSYGNASLGGIYRFDATGASAWSASTLTEMRDGADNRIGADSLTTDGTRLFTTITNSSDPSFDTDSHQDRVTAYSVNGSGQLAQEWQTDVGTNKSFFGLSYGGNGYVYGVDAGDGGLGHIWAFDAVTGDATNLGAFQTPGTDRFDYYLPGAGTIGTAVDDDKLYIVGTGGYLSVFTLDTPVSISGQVDYNIGADLIANGINETSAKPVALLGVAADEGFLWISFEADDDYPLMNHRVAGYLVPEYLVPEPAGLGLIGLALLAVRKRRS